MNISLVIAYHLKNKIFDVNDVNVNRDNCIYPFYLLRKNLLNENFNISTFDLLAPDNADISFYFDYNEDNGFSKLNYLFLLESKIIKEKGWKLDVQNKFNKVFTWDDSLVDNKKFFKINYTHLFPTYQDWNDILIDFEHKKLCTMIAGNKVISNKLELYSERVNAIKWFESKANKNDFHFYGMGWDNLVTKNKYINSLLKKIGISKFLAPKYKSYMGAVDNKKLTLNQYKFCICFENAKDLTGYISEKIFDCFFSGCIPIYFGAPNIDVHIPKNCFIDFRDFNSYDDIYDFISNISDVEYQAYINAIESFLFSSKAEVFKAESFVSSICEHLVSDVKKVDLNE